MMNGRIDDDIRMDRWMDGWIHGWVLDSIKGLTLISLKHLMTEPESKGRVC